MKRQSFEIKFSAAINHEEFYDSDDCSKLSGFSSSYFLKGCASNLNRSDQNGPVKASPSSLFNAHRLLSALRKLMTIAFGVFLTALVFSSLDATQNYRLLRIALGILIIVTTYPFAVPTLKWYTKFLNLDIEVDFLAAVLGTIYGLLIVGLSIL